MPSDKDNSTATMREVLWLSAPYIAIHAVIRTDRMAPNRRVTKYDLGHSIKLADAQDLADADKRTKNDL